LEHVLKVRDSILKQNVPGPSDGSYLQTERDSLFYPFAVESNLGKEYVYEVRGLNMCVNDFYGGPFICLTLLNKKNNRIYVIEGYVYAPNFHKREYLREVEAMLYSLKFE